MPSYQLSRTLLGFNTSLTPKNRKLLLSQAISQMGEVYEIQRQPDLARQQYEASRQIALETRSQVNLAYADERLGDFFITRNQPEQAIKLFDEALAIWIQLNDDPGQATVWAQLSICTRSPIGPT